MAEPLDLGYALGLKPEGALEYFRAKGYGFSWDWFDIYEGEHKQQFTVAKAMQMDILRDIRGALDKALNNGDSLETFKKGLIPMLQARGWWGRQLVASPKGGVEDVQLGSHTRLETIYRTNVQTAMMAGRYRQQIENVEDRPFWQYVAVMDALTRPAHAQMNGLVFRYDDPFWKYFYPPCGFSCRCRVRALTQAQVRAKGLEVRSGAGLIDQVDVEVAKGVVRKVARFRDGGINVSPDPGWSYNPGVKDWSPVLPKYAPPLQDSYKEAIRGRGLAKANRVRTFADLNPLLQAFDAHSPDIFRQGFKSIEIAKKADFFLATDCQGNIKVSDRVFKEAGGFKPSRDLREAMAAIGRGKDLTFHQEYAVEGLWHEILHNRAKGSGFRPHPYSFSHAMMETLNQWVARHTYPEFLASMGGLEAHGAAILEGGFGYGRWVSNFRSILKAAGIKETEALELLRPISYDGRWDIMPSLVSEALADLYGDKAWKDKFLRVLVLLDREPGPGFGALVRDILQEG